jgi:hypothetical protein
MFLCEGRFCPRHNSGATEKEWTDLRKVVKQGNRYKFSIISKNCPALKTNLSGRKVISESHNLILVKDSA